MEALGIDFKFVLVQAVGFLLLVALLKKFAFGPILGMLQQRQDNIRNNLDEAEARRVEMEKLQQEYEARLAKIEEEARDKIQAAVREAQIARDEIISKARSESETVTARGREQVERERLTAMAEMRDQISELAIRAASQVVRQSLDGQKHSQLIDDVIGSIGRNGGVGQAPSAVAGPEGSA